MRLHEDLDFNELTDSRVLNAIATDYTLAINKLEKNCRNISDEVFPGVRVGDR